MLRYRGLCCCHFLLDSEKLGHNGPTGPRPPNKRSGAKENMYKSLTDEEMTNFGVFIWKNQSLFTDLIGLLNIKLLCKTKDDGGNLHYFVYSIFWYLITLGSQKRDAIGTFWIIETLCQTYLEAIFVADILFIKVLRT